VSLAELDDGLREQAMRRWRVLRPHVEDWVPLSSAARAAEVPLRTAQRWLERYRADGLTGLVRRARGDRGDRRLPSELVELVEGLAVRRPRPSAAFVHRQVLAVAEREGWPAPSYSTVYGIVRALDAGLVTPAHDRPARYRDRYELVYRREAEPNDVWQSDHTQLDLLVVDQAAHPRPWLTVILDDHSRGGGQALAGSSRTRGDTVRRPRCRRLTLGLRAGMDAPRRRNSRQRQRTDAPMLGLCFAGEDEHHGGALSASPSAGPTNRRQGRGFDSRPFGAAARDFGALAAARSGPVRPGAGEERVHRGESASTLPPAHLEQYRGGPPLTL
jgi:hypothetical protein